MQTFVALVLLWFSHWTSTLHGVPVTQIIPQENFDLGKFMGVWYEVAVTSTCPLYMQRRRGSSAGAAMEMRPSESAANINVTSSTFRSNSCQERSTQYHLTDTPGRFLYHVPRLSFCFPYAAQIKISAGHNVTSVCHSIDDDITLSAGLSADVELNVVQTNYDEFAMMVLLSTERPTGTRTTILKLYGRTANMTSGMVSEFTSLVQRHGINPDSIVTTEPKGCKVSSLNGAP
ncbi:protein AMBP-like isoform X1 [Synchiropus splendidus]|uniref:protein AMBP-like isoform X1 n=1 Tax=Synchiropus splendidus TaxID=270530 RepID=UPI00237E130E|nr:protein AMBP-like isoform X1 [Synchiropus splendidus]